MSLIESNAQRARNIKHNRFSCDSVEGLPLSPIAGNIADLLNKVFEQATPEIEKLRRVPKVKQRAIANHVDNFTLSNWLVIRDEIWAILTDDEVEETYLPLLVYPYRDYLIDNRCRWVCHMWYEDFRAEERKDV
mgnify:CR=1 FL=1